MDARLKRILPKVQKPARYVGGEYGQITKDKAQVNLQVALCFPDVYEIAMSNLGLHILYGLFNQVEDIWCQRVFAPEKDMEAAMRKENIPLYALESGAAVSEFDLLGFSLGYEMAYTTVLNMLDLAQIPRRANQRGEDSPFVFAGGTSCYNPEPMADFFDFFVLGEGEEVGLELLQTVKEKKQAGAKKAEVLAALAQIQGIYVPSLYDVSYGTDGAIAQISPQAGAPDLVVKRVVSNLEDSYVPTGGLVPGTEIVHDRVVLEVFRGCMRGCRFCQAGYVYRPVREKSVETLTKHSQEALAHSGYQEMSLSSLSTSDYPELSGLCDHLLDYCAPRMINLSLPSLRADNFSMDLVGKIQKVRKSSLTFAPEAGSQRLRDVINKDVTEEALLESLKNAFAGGYSAVKLYFMLGLPTETDEDVLEIAGLLQKVQFIWKNYASNKARGLRLSVSTSCFIPKAHSAFQWEEQINRVEYLRRVSLLRDNIRAKNISYNWHDAETSYIEAVLSRGDRRLADVIESAWQAGANLESWSEHFSLERWEKAFLAHGIDPDFYAKRQREKKEVLPWAHLSSGVSSEFLWRERETAYAAQISPNCRLACLGCGVKDCTMKGGV